MKIAWHMPTFRRACCGLSIRALRLADGLRQQGHEITFIVAANKTDVTANSIDGHPVEKRTLPNTRALHWSLQSLTRRRAALAMVDQIDFEHDLMLTCQPEFAAEYGRRCVRHPLIFVCGGTTLLHDGADAAQSAGRSWFQRRLYAIDRCLKHRNERAAFLAADAVVFDSHATRELAVRDYRLDPERCRTIHGGVDPDTFVPPTDHQRILTRQKLGIEETEHVLVWTGRVSPEKNLDLLLHALACCRPPPNRLLIVGDGPVRDDLVRLRDRLGLGCVVSFLGEQPDVRPFLHAADGFVFPSRGESFGGSLVEAMACGLPCIALRPDGGAIRNASLEILETEKTGLLVDRAEPAAFAAVIERLMADRELRSALGRAGRRRAESSFTWSAAAAQLNELVVRVSSRKPKGRFASGFGAADVAFSR